MKLWEIADALERLVSDHTDRETGILDERFEKALDQLVMDRDAKALAVARFLLGERAEGEAVKAQADRLKRRAQIHENKAKRMEAYLQTWLPAQTNLADDVAEIRWSKPEIVDGLEDQDLSKWSTHFQKRFVKTTLEPRKNDLKAAIKAGEEVPKGVHLRKRPKLRVG